MKEVQLKKNNTSWGRKKTQKEVWAGEESQEDWFGTFQTYVHKAFW